MFIAGSYVYLGLAALPAGSSASTGQVLSYRITNLVFWGILLCASAVFVVRRFGPTWVWRGWSVFFVSITTLGALTFHQSFPEGAGSHVTTVYMLSVFVGIPTAVIAFTSDRLNRRTPPRPWIGHFARTFGAFLVSIPPALVIGAIPDIARMF